MLTFPPSVEIFLASKPVDMRKGFDGLMAIVRNDWKFDPYSGHLFCFVGKRLDRIKILFWDRGGFVIHYKRVERGRFVIPEVRSNRSSVSIEGPQLVMLLEGIDLSRVRRPRRWKPPQNRDHRSKDGSTRRPESDPRS